MRDERAGLRLKQAPEDFRVEEELAFTPTGAGEHLYLFVEKSGLGTDEVTRELARAASVAPRDVGYAGRKDRQAVTLQWFSVPTPGSLPQAEGDGWRVVAETRHESKLRQGALAGNHFRLVLRGETAPHRPAVEDVLEAIRERGLPNRFGPQRFGAEGRADHLGRRLLAREWRELLVDLCQQAHWPQSEALGQLREVLAREGQAGHRGLGRIAGALPSELAPIARQLARRRGDFSGAVRALDRRLVVFALSALQARVFNRVLELRGDTFATPALGDLLQLHPGRSYFPVSPQEDLRGLAERARLGELSPTGPIPGWRAELARGAPGELEREALSALEVEPEAFRGICRGVSPQGSRRSLRALVTGLEASWSAEALSLCFGLPPGSYATVLVEELGVLDESR